MSSPGEAEQLPFLLLPVRVNGLLMLFNYFIKISFIQFITYRKKDLPVGGTNVSSSGGESTCERMP